MTTSKDGGGNACVLVAESDNLIRRLAVRGLRACGHNVMEARDGAEAVRRAERTPAAIDLVVTDASMPGMGGADVARHVRVLHPGAGVLFLSDDAAGRPRPWPHAVYMPKHFLPAELARAAGEALAAAGAQSGPVCVA
jgi:CheY-like chemotaxis protein